MSYLNSSTKMKEKGCRLGFGERDIYREGDKRLNRGQENGYY